jgi:maltose O-acetyltransferase
MRSEREKMLAGENYLASDPELVGLRRRARRLTRAYNETPDEEPEKREATLRELFGKLGKKVVIEPPFQCDYGSQIFAGNYVFLNFGCTILDCAEVHFGDGVLCGPNVQIYTATHPLEAKLRNSGPQSAKPIRIGKRVWIGGGSILCPGISIGDNTTIGAGSVVTRDIPEGVLAVGNPCRVIRKISGRL